MNRIQRIIQMFTISHEDSQNKKTINNNGFTTFPNLYQIVAVLLPILALSIFMFIVHTNNISSIQTEFQNVITIFTGLLFVFSAIAWYKVTSIVPTDIVQKLHEQNTKESQKTNYSQYRFCQACKLYTEDYSSHCQECNRCVTLFDHHSKWVNNCIGANNYFQFFWLILINLIIFTIQLVSSIFILIESQKAIYDEPILILLCLSICLDTICLVPLIYLVVYHSITICKKKIATSLIFDYRRTNQIFPAQISNSQVKKRVHFENGEQNNYKIKKMQSEQCSRQDTLQNNDPQVLMMKILPPLQAHKYKLKHCFNFKSIDNPL